jgi:2'-5' RNA ligase
MHFKQWILAEKRGETYSFSSTHVTFPDDISKKVIEWGKKHISDKLLVDKDKAHGREDEIHVTALYGLHTESPKDVQTILKDFAPFDIRLGKVSKFEGNGYDVIKFDVHSGPLRKLHKALQQLDHTSSHKIYHPHCTIAYVKSGSCDHLLGNEDLNNLKTTANSITFSSKNGQKTEIKLR